jgi:hypothetical protein
MKLFAASEVGIDLKFCRLLLLLLLLMLLLLRLASFGPSSLVRSQPLTHVPLPIRQWILGGLPRPAR